MAGLDNTMPIVGGEIITLEFIPDHQVIGGYGGEYVLVEREGGTFASSDLPLFVQDKPSTRVPPATTASPSPARALWPSATTT